MEIMSRRKRAALTGMVLAALVANTGELMAKSDRGAPCAPGAVCLKVEVNGNPNPAGPSRAQCTGDFPDYIVAETMFPAGFKGPWFKLSQKYPKKLHPKTPYPWEKIDFWKGVPEANAYLYALRDYAFEGMIDADFRPQDNPVRRWFHVPLMNYSSTRRELIHGLTRERTLRGPELGIKNGVFVSNYAIGFYNDVGGYTIGRVWAPPGAPHLGASQFAPGTMVFKILFSAAKPEDFDDPGSYLLEGAPEWQIATGDGKLTSVRLLQVDVAVRDSRRGPGDLLPNTGWVFGTFAYDRNARDASPWNRVRPVGLMWGNDPGYTPADQAAGKPLRQSIISNEAPAYAKTHLGWAGRLNGPVDNPISACMSCHGTAQYQVNANIFPFPSCRTDAQKLFWFRNLTGKDAFGAVDSTTCLPEAKASTALDFSLQMGVAVQSVLEFNDKNPCVPPEARPMASHQAAPSSDARRITRDGLVEEDEHP